MGSLSFHPASCLVHEVIKNNNGHVLRRFAVGDQLRSFLLAIGTFLEITGPSSSIH
jgi:hypothetical protein